MSVLGPWLIGILQSVGFSLTLVMISNNVRVLARVQARSWVVTDFSQVGGFTKKTFTTAVIFTGYCIGNIIG